MVDPDLGVYFGDRRVGQLSADPLGFEYDPAWRAAPEGFPIAIALPLTQATFTAEQTAAFFFNLLPEGNVRRRIAGRLGISEGNDYALLAAIGGECAGALSVLASPPKIRAKDRYEELSDEDLVERLETGGAFSSATGVGGVRLSLAGAQDKLPVYLDGGRTFLPKGTAPSSHILKFDSRDFKHLTANEVFVIALARAAGLPVVEASLKRFGRYGAAVIERYDRRRSGPAMVRLHQEDFCQALGLPPERKYELEGGPTFARCVDLVRRHSADPARDTHAAIRWQLFNVAAGNADGHAKNLALLHTRTGPTLAPFFDLVCTRAYPRVERRMAMKIGGKADPDKLTGRDWSVFAAELGVGERYLRETGQELAESVLQAVDPTLRALETQAGRKDYLRSTVVPVIRSATRRLGRSLR